MYYPIDENMARLSHQMMSMSDYREGSATAEYHAAVDKAAALVERQKQKVSPFYHEKLDDLLDRYARHLARWTNDHNRNGASCPSVLICGPANFPTKKKNRQNAREDVLWKEYEEIQSILSKIKSVGTGPIDPADPHARKLLEDRLQRLQNTLDKGKTMNAHYRKHKTMKGFPGMTNETAAKMDEAISSAPAFAQSPLPDFELASLRGKIKRAQKNLAKLDSMEQHKDDAANTLEFDGGKIFLNMKANRLQILFDEIPSEEIRTALKSHSFKWSRQNKAWQRQLTRNAVYDVRQILNIPAPVKPALASEGTAHQSASPALPKEVSPLDILITTDGQLCLSF